MTDALTLLRGDLSQELFDKYVADGRVAWDIETSGLDWRTGKIGTCQLHSPISGTAVVQIVEQDRPSLLTELLADFSVLKVFHHAPFDLRWMATHWNVTPASVACTKVASRLLNPAPESAEHSLKHLMRTYLGVEVDKGQQTSDWLANDLTAEQVAYAAGDVVNLLGLHDVLEKELTNVGLHGVYQQCLEYLPTRVLLEVGGWPDVFSY